MVRLVRGLVGLALLVGSIVCAFRVPLGARTFAEHVDNIGASPQAKELVDGARGTVNPVIEEATQRVLGEHVEAPTRIESAGEPTPAATSVPRKRAGAVPGAASGDRDPKLPGR